MSRPTSTTVPPKTPTMIIILLPALVVQILPSYFATVLGWRTNYNLLIRQAPTLVHQRIIRSIMVFAKAAEMLEKLDLFRGVELGLLSVSITVSTMIDPVCTPLFWSSINNKSSKNLPNYRCSSTWQFQSWNQKRSSQSEWSVGWNQLAISLIRHLSASFFTILMILFFK